MRTGAAVADQGAYVGEPASSAGPDIAGLLEIDGAIQSTLSRPGRPTDLTRPGFVPPPDEQTALSAIQDDYLQLTSVMASVLAFDSDEELVQKARASTPRALSERIRFEVSDATEIELPETEFDLALFSWSL